MLPCVEPVLIQTYLLIYFWKRVWRIYSSLPHVCFLVSTPQSSVLIIMSVKPFPECLFWTTSSNAGKGRQSASGKQGSGLAANAFWSCCYSCLSLLCILMGWGANPGRYELLPAKIPSKGTYCMLKRASLSIKGYEVPIAADSWMVSNA